VIFCASFVWRRVERVWRRGERVIDPKDADSSLSPAAEALPIEDRATIVEHNKPGVADGIDVTWARLI